MGERVELMVVRRLRTISMGDQNAFYLRLEVTHRNLYLHLIDFEERDAILEEKVKK